MVFALFKVKLRTKKLAEPEKVSQSACNIAKRAQGVKIQPPDCTQNCETFFFCFETKVWLGDRQSKPMAMIGPEYEKKVKTYKIQKGQHNLCPYLGLGETWRDLESWRPRGAACLRPPLYPSDQHLVHNYTTYISVSSGCWKYRSIMKRSQFKGERSSSSVPIWPASG